MTDALPAVLPGTFEKTKAYDGILRSGRYARRNLFILNPLTYMNASGRTVAFLLRQKKILPVETLVIHDDIDLPLGRIRICRNGGSAGHKGVESIINELEDVNFARLRIGIGKDKKEGRVDYVLAAFSENEKAMFLRVVDMAVDAIKLILHRGLEKAMNEFNSRCLETVEMKTNGEKN